MTRAWIGIALFAACAAHPKVAPPAVAPPACESAILPAPARADFEAFVSAYAAAPADTRADLAAKLVADRQARGGFPIVEDGGTVVFVFIGDGSERDVRAIGDFRAKSFFRVDWDRGGLPLARAVDGGGLWYARARFHGDARLDYQLVVDGHAGPDPLNPHATFSGIADGPASELIMPAVHTAVPRADVPHGSIVAVDEAWARPRITIYTPPGYDARQRYPVIYTADGAAWRDLIRLPVVLDDAIARGAIAPAIAVMIDAAEDRSAWYTWSADYLAYLDKVVAYVDARYATRAEASARIHVGTSAGGRASLQVAIERSSTFANVALLSPSIQLPLHVLAPYLDGRRALPRPRRVWLSAGRYEGAICEDARALASWLDTRGIAVRTMFTREGHSFGTWRHAVPEMLAYFLAR